MKKSVIILLIAAVLFTLTSCTNTNDSYDNSISFKATIIEPFDDYAIVEPFEGEPIRNSADKISIYLGDCNDTFSVGDNILVYYDGAVMESYPAQVNVLGVEKID